MGSGLTTIGVLGALALASTSAVAQPGPLPAGDFAKQGKARYDAGDFAGAVEPLRRAVELEPNNVDYKLTLANALRQSNNCAEARPLYQQLLASAQDEATRQQVQAQAAYCPDPQVQVAPQPPTPEPPAPAPSPVTVSTSGSPKRSDMFMLAGGGALVGAGAMLLWAAHTHAGDADAARSVSDHDRISGRATAEYIVGGIGIAVGVGLSVWAMKRLTSSTETDIAVAVMPRANGGSFVLEHSW